MKQGNGYVGYSKSVNAINAESDGFYPKTKAVDVLFDKLGGTRTRKTIRNVIDNIGPCEWHHTSKFYNKTPYYDTASIYAYLINMELIQEIQNILKNHKLVWDADLKLDLSTRSRNLAEALQKYSEKHQVNPQIVREVYYEDWIELNKVIEFEKIKCQ